MPSPFGEAPKAKSLLDFQRVLSPTAGIRVSPLCLGAMNFGDAWEGLMGKCDKKTTFEILDYFYEQGGNFIDTYVELISQPPRCPPRLASLCYVEEKMADVKCDMQRKQLPKRRIRNLARRMDVLAQKPRLHRPRDKIHNHISLARHQAASSRQPRR